MDFNISTQRPMTLADLKPKTPAVITSSPDQRLAEMGLCVENEVTVLAKGSSFIVKVNSQRLCLSRAYAKTITVKPI